MLYSERANPAKVHYLINVRSDWHNVRTVNADVNLQVTSMTTSKYVIDYAMKRCSVDLGETQRTVEISPR